jgi:hypothetical protein
MNERATLEALDAQHDYLRRDGDTATLITNAAAFTRHAAWLLRENGWGNVRKTSGEQRENLDVDKLLNKHTLEMVDIVVAAGHSSQHVGWNPVATGTPSQWVAPQPPPGEVPEPGPTPEPELPDFEALLDRVDEIEQHTARIADQNAEILGLVRRAAERFGV